MSLCAVLAVLLLAGAAGCASAKPPASPPDPNLTCRLKDHPASYVNSLKRLPPAIRAALTASAGAIADRGEFFNAGDVVTKPAPFNRFIRGGDSDGRWFVWYEHGGIAYWHQVVVFAANPRPVPWFNGPSTNADLCAMTDAILSQPVR